MNHYLWMDSRHPAASYQLCKRMHLLLNSISPFFDILDTPILFLCIGTPEIPGDSLGPRIGSYLSDYFNYPVFGTCDKPVHALNLKSILQDIYNLYENPMIIVIDAAMGNRFQEGFITLKKGPLHPGSGLGKQLPAVGHIQITGVFQSLYGKKAQSLVTDYVQCIFDGLRLLSLDLCQPVV